MTRREQRIHEARERIAARHNLTDMARDCYVKGINDLRSALWMQTRLDECGGDVVAAFQVEAPPVIHAVVV